VLVALPGVLHVVPFGNALHISGTDAAALSAALAPYRAQPELQWSLTEAGLEDVFIQLMQEPA
jgi:ABC-2 type transport system ATP-binding protein